VGRWGNSARKDSTACEIETRCHAYAQRVMSRVAMKSGMVLPGGVQMSGSSRRVAVSAWRRVQRVCRCACRPGARSPALPEASTTSVHANRVKVNYGGQAVVRAETPCFAAARSMRRYDASSAVILVGAR